MNDCGGFVVPVRALAASAGIQFGNLQLELYRLRDKLGPRSEESLRRIDSRLAHGGAVSEAEQRALLELGARGFEVDSNREFEKFLHYVRALHKRMLSDPNTSPVALAIVGVIANYAVPSPTKLGHHGRVLA